MLLGLRLVEGLLQAFFPYSVPHVWRQTDTLGVGIRYAQRWVEGSGGWDFWLPSVLNASTSLGIMPMEFPLYNFLLAFGYFLNWEDGARYASLLTYAWGLLLWGGILWVWRKHRILGMPAARIWLLLPILGQSWIYWFKVMPDFTAMAFVLIACGYAWEDEWHGKWLALCFAALGLLIKPPVCIGLALLLLGNKKYKLVRHIPWILASLCVTMAYYTKGLDFIRLYMEGDRELFAVQLHTPWSQWVSLLTAWKEILLFFYDGMLFPGGLFCLLLLYGQPHPAAQSMKKVGLVLLLQFIAIVSLDGGHSFTHRYYYIGMSPLLCVGVYLTFSSLWVRWNPTRVQLVYVWVFGVLWLGALIDRFGQDLLPVWQEHSARHKFPPFSQCRILRQRHPEFPWQQGAHFRSDAEIYPLLGVCFGERQGGKQGAWGFYWIDTIIPVGCREIDKTEAVKLVQCEEKS